MKRAREKSPNTNISYLNPKRPPPSNLLEENEDLKFNPSINNKSVKLIEEKRLQ